MPNNVQLSILKHPEVLEVLHFFSSKKTSIRIKALAPAHAAGQAGGLTFIFETPPTRRAFVFVGEYGDDHLFHPLIPYEYNLITVFFGNKTTKGHSFFSYLNHRPPVHSLVSLAESKDYCFFDFYPNMDTTDSYICFGSFHNFFQPTQTLLQNILASFTNLYSTKFNYEILLFFYNIEAKYFSQYLLQKFMSFSPLIKDQKRYFSLLKYSFSLTKEVSKTLTQKTCFPFFNGVTTKTIERHPMTFERNQLALLEMLSHPKINYNFSSSQFKQIKPITCKNYLKIFEPYSSILESSDNDIYDDDDQIDWGEYSYNMQKFVLSDLPITTQRQLLINFKHNAQHFFPYSPIPTLA